MTMESTTDPTEASPVSMDEERTAALVERLFEAALGAVDMVAVYLGDRLGLYRALADSGASTPAELASRAGILERYAREWLEQQAVTGILEVDDQAKPEGERKYSLPPAHAEALIDLDSMFSITPLARAFVAAIQAAPQLMDAFANGGGVPWSAFGPDMIESQGDFNRPWILSLLGTEYLPSIPDVHERLQSDPPARVADVACGVGWASIAIARAYPTVRGGRFRPGRVLRRDRAGTRPRGRGERPGPVRGPRRCHPRERGTVRPGHRDRVDPRHGPAGRGARGDTGQPGSQGTLIVADEKVAESFTAPGDPVERLMYGFSFLVCLPAGLSEVHSVGTGTVMRPDTFRRYAGEAGFKQVEILDQVEHDFLRFYRLRP
jgi:hypothetical protein